MQKLSLYYCQAAFFLSCIMFTTACEHSNDDYNTSPSMSDKSMLSFKSLDDFSLTVTKIGKMSDAELQNYESEQIGFVSMRSLFKKAMIEEEENYSNEEAHEIASHIVSKTLVKFPEIALKANVGGYEINLADFRMASLLNSKGMVRIGENIHQYTKQFNKVIKDDPNTDNEYELLKNKDGSDASIGLLVGKNTVIATITPSNAKVSGTVFGTRSCDELDGSNPSKYRLITYEESILEETPVGPNTTQQVTVSIPTVGPAPNYTVTYSPVTYPVSVQNGRTYKSFHQVKVRTLKRGMFGAWYNCDTGLQKVEGKFKLQGNIALSYTSLGVLSTNLLQYSKTPTGTTSTFEVTLAESQVFNNAADAQNVRFDVSSTHTATWDKDGKTCLCKIE